jgi:hypothetical protein
MLKLAMAGVKVFPASPGLPYGMTRSKPSGCGKALAARTGGWNRLLGMTVGPVYDSPESRA